jgi:hypothetical protein
MVLPSLIPQPLGEIRLNISDLNCRVTLSDFSFPCTVLNRHQQRLVCNIAVGRAATTWSTWTIEPP